MKSILVALAVVVIGASAPEQNVTVPVRERIITRTFVIHVPTRPCAVPAVVQFIAGSVEAVSGTEYAPVPCDWGKPGPTPVDEINLLGMTIEQAFDALIKVDPRYAWQESGGVIVLRPAAAWVDEKHFLHESFGPIEFDNKAIGGALDAVKPIIGRKPGDGVTEQLAGRTPQGWQEFSVKLPVVSGLDALNGIARAHGNLHWELKYCEPAVTRKNAELMFYTTDKSGLGMTGGCRRPGGAIQ